MSRANNYGPSMTNLVARASRRKFKPVVRQSWKDGKDLLGLKHGDIIRGFLLTEEALPYLSELKCITSEGGDRLEMWYYHEGKSDSLVTRHQLVAWQRLCEDPKGIPMRVLMRGMQERKQSTAHLPTRSCVPLFFNNEQD